MIQLLGLDLCFGPSTGDPTWTGLTIKNAQKVAY
jgi:hypothetical protein